MTSSVGSELAKPKSLQTKKFAKQNVLKYFYDNIVLHFPPIFATFLNTT